MREKLCLPILQEKICAKHTHIDQYLHWKSHHSITNKYSVYDILTLRTQTVCSNLQLLGQEYQYIKTALNKCKYPNWVFHRLKTEMDYKLSLQHHYNNPYPHRDTNKNKDIFIVVPYSKELSECIMNICGKVGAKGALLGHLRCRVENIGETGSNFGDRYKEHLRSLPLL